MKTCSTEASSTTLPASITATRSQISDHLHLMGNHDDGIPSFSLMSAAIQGWSEGLWIEPMLPRRTKRTLPPVASAGDAHPLLLSPESSAG